MTPLVPDTSYHIFNHANGFEKVFRKEENFYFFLEKYRKHIGPIAETYAYCLMPNHFHLVVRIRKRAIIEELIRNKKTNNFSNNNFFKVSYFEKSINKIQSDFDNTTCINFGNDKISDSEIEKYLSKQFANLFSSYTQSFNKVYHRMGSLFIKNFKREPIHDKTYFLNAIVYTHRNPVHHRFCSNYEDWDYSSYNEIVNGVCDQIELKKLLKMTNGVESFIKMHRNALLNFPPINDLEIPTPED